MAHTSALVTGWMAVPLPGLRDWRISTFLEKGRTKIKILLHLLHSWNSWNSQNAKKKKKRVEYKEIQKDCKNLSLRISGAFPNTFWNFLTGLGSKPSQNTVSRFWVTWKEPEKKSKRGAVNKSEQSTFLQEIRQGSIKNNKITYFNNYHQEVMMRAKLSFDFVTWRNFCDIDTELKKK